MLKIDVGIKPRTGYVIWNDKILQILQGLKYTLMGVM